MEEDNELEMGMFGKVELNFNPEDYYTHEDNEDNDDPEEIKDKNINDTVEDEDPEDVDSDNDDEDEGSGEDNKGKSSSNLYSSLAAVIHEQGLLPSLDITASKIESLDDFTEALNKEQEIQVKIKLDEYISNLDVQSIAQSKKEIQNLESIDSDTLKDNLELAKSIIYKDYLNQGIGEKKASHLLKRLIDLGEDAILEDATESLDSLKEFETRKIEETKDNYLKQVEQDKIDQVKLETQLKSVIYDNKEPLKGLKVTKALQDKVYKSINEIVGKSPDGVFENKFMKARRENPIEFEARMYFLYELTDGFTNYSKITTTAKSKAVTDLETLAKKAGVKDNGTPQWMQDGESYFNSGRVQLNY